MKSSSKKTRKEDLISSKRTLIEPLRLFHCIIIIIVYYTTKAANIHSYTYKRTIKNKIKLKKTLKFLTYKTH